MRIQSGTASASSDEFEWELHKGHGPRTHSETVTFPEEFTQPPTVVVSLTGFDLHTGQNARIEVRAVRPDSRQFTLIYKTWGNTFLHKAWVSWIAYGT